MFERFLLPAQRRHVAYQHHVILRLPLLVAHRADLDQAGEAFPVLPAAPGLALPVTGLGQRVQDDFEFGRSLPAGREHVGRTPDDLRPLEAGDPAEGLVHVDDAAVRIDDDDSFAGVAEHAGGQSEPGVRVLLCGDVPRDLGGADDAAGRVTHRRHRYRHVDASTVAVQPLGFVVVDLFAVTDLVEYEVLLRHALRREQPEHRLVQHVLLAVAEHPGGTVVPARDATVQRLADDGVVRRFDDGPEVLRCAGDVGRG